MYEEDYGTDWTALTLDEAIERAFALGVERALGHEYPGEYDRVHGEGATAYDRTLIELSFDEGRTLGREYEPTEREAAWDTLVGGVDFDDWLTVDEDDLEETVPGIVSRIGAIDPPRQDTRSLELPRFLLRRR